MNLSRIFVVNLNSDLYTFTFRQIFTCLPPPGFMTEQKGNLEILSNISELVSRSTDLEECLPAVMEKYAGKFGIEQAVVSVLDRNSSRILIEVIYGLSRQEMEKGDLKIGERIIEEVLRTREPFILPSAAPDPFYLHHSRASEETGTSAFICMPVWAKNQIIGTLSVKLREGKGKYYSSELPVLRILSSLLSHLVRSRQDRIGELEKLQNTMLIEHGLYSFNDRLSTLVGESGKMKAVYDMIARVAMTNATILIRGESGVGKELVAQSIHDQSSRSGEEMVKVNCAAIPESLIESELFGYEKGAFTGADRLYKGRFEQAENSTIFLDEIGDLPPGLQVKLLRVLQEREYQRLGGRETIRANVRVIAATNRNLEEMMVKGEFREDLYYRLNVFPILVPPLRDRRGDIPLLVNHFIEKLNRIHGLKIRRISSTAIDLLMTYHWPGNIRELGNCIERAAILSTDEVIRSHNLPPTLQSAASTDSRLDGSLGAILENVEKQLLIDALNISKGNITRAAELLKLTERVMGLRIRKYKIDPAVFRKKNRSTGVF